MISKLSKIQLLAGILILVLLLGGGILFALRGTIKSTINGYRADRLFGQAQEAFEQENWDQAARKATAAFYLDQDNIDTSLLVARALLKQRQPSTVGWWIRAIDHPEIPTDELRLLTEVVFSLNRLDEGLLFLNRLVELDGGNPETRELWFKVLQLQARYSSSINLAAALVEGGSSDWDVHRNYIRLQEALSGTGGSSLAIDHLTKMVESDSALSRLAARDLVVRNDAPLETRMTAANYLDEKGESPMDRLYAASVEFREGMGGMESLKPYLEAILDEPADGDLAELAAWALWLGRAEWFVTRVDWNDYIANGNKPDLYLRAMLDAGLNQRLLSLAEEIGTQGGSDSPAFLYYRSVAQRNLGNIEEAEGILSLATQVVAPDESEVLEVYLLQDNRWDLLQRLFETQIRDNPGDPVILQKLLTVHYYLGHQDDLALLVRDLDVSDLDSNPSTITFLLYLKVLLGSDRDATHQELESMLARYPEVFDIRLVLGLSYLLQDQRDVSSRFKQGMPVLNRTAPRYIRVCSMILGDPGADLLAPGEIELLLPRERLLLSQASQQATP